VSVQIERIPRWIVVIGLIGTPVAGLLAGPWSALAFAAGAAGSWWNFRYLQGAVGLLAKAAAAQTSPGSARIVAGMFARLLVLAIGSIVILRYSKSSLIALLTGLFASCLAILLEILYELLWKSTKSG
jgi:hypothetical protein